MTSVTVVADTEPTNIVIDVSTTATIVPAIETIDLSASPMSAVALTENLEVPTATVTGDIVLTAPRAAKISDWAEASASSFQVAQAARSNEVGMSAGNLSQPTEPQQPIEIGVMQQNALQPDENYDSRRESQERSSMQAPDEQSSQDAEGDGRCSPLRQMMNQRRKEKMQRKLAREAKRAEKEAKRAEKDKTKHVERAKRLKQLGA